MLEEKIDKLHDKVDALRQEWAADRVLLAERLARTEERTDANSGRIKLVLTVVGTAALAGLGMLWDWLKVKLGIS